jgi:hypothetical protein
MTKRKNPKHFFLYEDLKTWEKTAMVVYAVTSLAVILTCFFANPDTKQIVLIGYITISQLGLYFGLYTSLRNFKAYLIWFGFGLVHLLLVFIFRRDPTLEMYRGNPSYLLVNTIILLLLFQLLRYISLKMQ